MLQDAKSFESKSIMVWLVGLCVCVSALHYVCYRMQNILKVRFYAFSIYRKGKKKVLILISLDYCDCC